jgi:hypothetical protein
VAAVISVLGTRAKNPVPLRFLKNLEHYASTPYPTQTVAKSIVLLWILRQSFAASSSTIFNAATESAVEIIEHGVVYGQYLSIMEPCFRLCFDTRRQGDVDYIIGARMLKGDRSSSHFPSGFPKEELY